jgi:hypothetical protein
MDVRIHRIIEIQFPLGQNLHYKVVRSIRHGGVVVRQMVRHRRRVGNCPPTVWDPVYSGGESRIEGYIVPRRVCDEDVDGGACSMDQIN